MLKRILLILISIFLILGCCACSSAPQTDSNTTEESNDETQNSDTETDNFEKVTISGENRYRIVYAKDADPDPAKKIYNRLKTLDKKAVSDDYYTLTTDEAPDDGTPEILVGLTNRKESSDAKNALESYLDWSIKVAGNKIIIYANTVERLSAAVSEFVSKLIKSANGDICYPTGTLIHKYDKYELPSLNISGANIDKFSIIVSANASENEKSAANDLQLWIAEKSGIVLTIKTDAEAITENEIIIGKTSRPENSDITDDILKDIYYSTAVTGTKVVMYAGDNGSIFSALSALKTNILASNGDVKDFTDSKTPSQITNKKAIFIGNSFIYWGGCVTFIQNDAEFEEIRAAGGDKGYFNEICKANGIEMDVYNYAYGTKNLTWIYENILMGKDKEFLDSIDYVFISEAGENNSNITTIVENISALFTNAEEIVYLAHENHFSSNHTNIINALPQFSKKEIKIVAWGALVHDIYTGAVSVPDATLQYNKNSFVKNSTGIMSDEAAVFRTNKEGDSFHQNPLSGYITAQMCFSAITGSLCEGQKYEFCWDATIAPQYDLQNFVVHQYNNGQTTNFVEIFNSPTDMLGIQKLMDVYMSKYN